MTNNAKDTILVVDDEEGILDVSEEYFERKGYDVYTARNGIEAIEIIKQVKIGCCFTDINMPEMDGLELAERIRGIDNTLPIVIMTGYPSLDNTIRTLKNGVVDFLVKPVNLEQMELSYKRIIRERGLFVENLILREEVERQERLNALNNQLLVRIDEVNTLNRIMEDFSSTASSDEIFNTVVALGREVVTADQVTFYTYTEQDSSFFPMAGSDDAFQGNTALSPGEKAFFTGVVKDNKACLVARARDNELLARNVLSFMAVPLKIREKTFGMVTASIFAGERRFGDKDIYYMNFITQKAASAIESIALYENIYDNLFSTLYAFVAALEARDPYTMKHSERVAEIAHTIGQEMGCEEEELSILKFAGRLHDIGKIGIRDDILLKPGRLTPDEYEKIKEHPAIGADIVGKLGLWDREQEIIRHHHERYDGTGYPDGLSGLTIPKLSRILSVADVFDAMASDRSYRRRMEKSKVLSTIEKAGGTQFDPGVVTVFLGIADKI
ncbi:predicted two-component system transcriptional regulator [Desulforapulum autotrophicum HRM2]|uniref:Predicted two-component system transcriptional regulator n=1 Tax=Desulforapulum autotrophicum (strain ATCC 43914 / DSM 3382 / VKM B-1955 / HRM2) TaxID=177437 RepID=C0QAL4_DESAH|nr:HD domain-containing phosphohydrolase [Desulforapulum autotrophicum]ACN16797.1 predicted two-component system transcriptional regulator [Desulforapulum autotrophicum HRM2]